MANKEKPRYDGRCRNLTEPRPGADSVVRFKTPLEGEVSFDDLVRGPINFQNSELDDLVLVRTDGNPTYNFSVVAESLKQKRESGFDSKGETTLEINKSSENLVNTVERNVIKVDNPES